MNHFESIGKNFPFTKKKLRKILSLGYRHPVLGKIFKMFEFWGFTMLTLRIEQFWIDKKKIFPSRKKSWEKCEFWAKTPCTGQNFQNVRISGFKHANFANWTILSWWKKISFYAKNYFGDEIIWRRLIF